MAKTVSVSKLRKMIKDFAKVNGAAQVWISWRNTMLKQGRSVEQIQMIWETLEDRDKVLDEQIAYDVLDDFVTYLETHPHNLALKSPAQAT